MLKFLKIWFLFCAFIAAPNISWAAQPPFPKTGSSIGVTFLRMLELVRNVQGRTIPLDAKVISQNLARYDAVWLCQDIIEYNRSAWNLIRQTAPEKIMLRYNCSISSRLKTRHILDYNYINTYHPEWFLLKDAKDPLKADPRNPDNRIRWDPRNKNSYKYNRFYLDGGNEEFQDWAVRQILDYVSGKTGEFNYGSWKSKRLNYPYSGLAFDNVVLRRIKVRFNKPYPNWKYANDIQGWKDGCWFRNYTNAKIVVNPTEMPRKVLIDRNKLWLDWTSKKTVSELTLSPKSGRILLATSYRAEAQTTGLGK